MYSTTDILKTLGYTACGDTTARVRLLLSRANIKPAATKVSGNRTFVYWGQDAMDWAKAYAPTKRELRKALQPKQFDPAEFHAFINAALSK